MRKKTTTTSKPTTKVESLSDDELILLRAALEVEMRKRGLGFSVGQIGESLVIRHFNSTPGLPNLLPAPTGTKNVDALSRNGDRFSIKTVWHAKKPVQYIPILKIRRNSFLSFS